MDIKSCKLCDSKILNVKHNLCFLNKYTEPLFIAECGSLFVKNAFWLDEAYKNSIGHKDTGVIQRILNNHGILIALNLIINFKNVLDYGGSTGLLTRYLRDYKINAFNYDEYERNIFSKKFQGKLDGKFDFINLCEVAEHFQEPKVEFEKILKLEPKFLLLNTVIYENEDKNWFYFNSEEGQHIFFYSRNCLQNYFAKNNYEVILKKRNQFLYKKEYVNFIQKTLIFLIMNRFTSRIFRGIVSFIPPKGIFNDIDLIE